MLRQIKHDCLFIIIKPVIHCNRHSCSNRCWRKLKAKHATNGTWRQMLEALLPFLKALNLSRSQRKGVILRHFIEILLPSEELSIFPVLDYKLYRVSVGRHGLCDKFFYAKSFIHISILRHNDSTVMIQVS